ncbi:tyrosine-protein phosphatase [Streptomyces sp. NPDC002952]|uniref:tyrosine-protein phosphatase n=1 Tax=Streptomyces sp. NPDC002952 TaxID=3364673 RepID=UPI0036B1932F
MARSLSLSGVLNARDLGGYRTADGRVIRDRVALRSDALHRLTEADVLVFANLGLRQVVDLRDSVEIRENGADRLPGRQVPDSLASENASTPMTIGPYSRSRVTLHHLPIYAREFDLCATLKDALTGHRPTSSQALPGDGDAARLMMRLYRWLVTDPVVRTRYAQVLRLLAEPGGIPLLFHCTAGKDRTGWAAALLLTALGVDRDTVFYDYLLTNERLAPLVEQLLDGLSSRGVVKEPELIRPVYRAEPAYLEAAFAEVETGWPSFDAFLTEGLGLDQSVLQALRANLLVSRI